MHGNPLYAKKGFPWASNGGLDKPRPFDYTVSEKGMEGEQYARRGCAERGRLVEGLGTRERKSPWSSVPERRQGTAVFRVSSFGDVSHLYAAGEEPAFAARFCETYDCAGERHD